MELVLLSGNSKKTEEWIKEVEKTLGSLFDSSHVQYYEHWKTGGETIDFDLELERLADYLKDKKEYVIFAKSAGVLLALRGIFERKIFPLKCMFAGVPVQWSKTIEAPLEKWIKNYNIPSYFIQKSHDPAIGAKDLDVFLKNNSVKNYKLIEIPGDDHHYGNLDELKKFMKELVSS